MYIPRYPTLWPKYFFLRERSFLPFPLNYENIIFYNRGLSAIFDAIKILGLSPGDKVLLPSYTCIDTVMPFLNNGIDISFYNINEDLSINKKDLENRIEDRVKALFFIHYFGFPQDLDYIEFLKKKFNIFLIEDCAHAFLSEINDRYLGNLGDVSIFTLRKMIPVHNVGILVVNNDEIDDLFSNYNKISSVFKGTLSRIIENIKFRSGITFPAKNLKMMEKAIESTIINNQQKKIYPKKGISTINKKLLNNFDYIKIKNTRRSNFEILLDWVKNRKNITPVFDSLPDGVSPMSFPVILEKRDIVCKLMNIHGIDAYPWPFLPTGLENSYKVSHYLAENIMLLPLHQDLKTKHLNYITMLLEKALAVASK
ncbi:MAG: hypothetical protein A2042_01470 [Candidatus Schekmanbacteria bacterium GWA2_38_11]|uniref:DegT/DnrJ/EryC1/StrS aminotransferase n=1 Tax=Candidatus Schekmanbacteria bacterium GWA2_38_11 TaxID=1817876 RepID=A0A1F7RKP4_9BACT|nr:MAG: hypothetical protein A2042_01470 [Candidatus Schekmanbacteria bacterium GWA2_38_11]